MTQEIPCLLVDEGLHILGRASVVGLASEGRIWSLSDATGQIVSPGVATACVYAISPLLKIKQRLTAPLVVDESSVGCALTLHFKGAMILQIPPEPNTCMIDPLDLKDE